MKTLIVLLLLGICVPASANMCCCTRESKERVCIAYYELIDLEIEEMSVKITCEEK